MLISDLAVRELEVGRDSFFDSCRRAFLMVFGRSSDHQLPNEVMPHHPRALRGVPHARSTPATRPIRVVSSTTLATVSTSGAPQPGRRHPQLRTAVQPSTPASPFRRSARLEAERAMILARGGKFAEAIEAFTTAASDPEIDLTALPGFWDLPRQGMMAAARAYEATRRIRDAAALEARMRHTLRPRAVRSIPSGEQQRRLTASGD